MSASQQPIAEVAFNAIHQYADFVDWIQWYGAQGLMLERDWLQLRAYCDDAYSGALDTANAVFKRLGGRYE